MFKFSVIVLCLLQNVCFSTVRCNTQQDKSNVIEELLQPGIYDPQMKPGNGNSTDSPTAVSINLHIISVSQIDDLKMLYTLELYFRQEWRDERLQFDSADIDVLSLGDSHKIWVPDIFFPQEFKSYFHDIMESNTYVKVNQNGTVFTSARITLVLRCPMHFGKFPFDKHVCSMTIESYKWKAEDLSLQWGTDPVSIANEVMSPLFSFDKFSIQSGLIATNSGEYSILSLNLHFSRQMKHYIVQLFVPCCLIFIVSCMASWLNPRLMTARMLIGLASLFSLAMLVLQFNQDTPKVPYPRASDVFVGMCLTFIFVTLVETVFVHLSESKEGEAVPDSNEVADKDDIEQSEKPVPKRNAMKQMKSWLYENHHTLNDIDAASRVLFPICFIIFLIIYSITCAAVIDA